MPYIGNKYEIGDHNNSWKTLDDISSYVATFDGSATNAVQLLTIQLEYLNIGLFRDRE